MLLLDFPHQDLMLLYRAIAKRMRFGWLAFTLLFTIKFICQSLLAKILTHPRHCRWANIISIFVAQDATTRPIAGYSKFSYTRTPSWEIDRRSQKCYNWLQASAPIKNLFENGHSCSDRNFLTTAKHLCPIPFLINQRPALWKLLKLQQT